jgi:hypothetical protein
MAGEFYDLVLITSKSPDKFNNDGPKYLLNTSSLWSIYPIVNFIYLKVMICY